MNENETTGAAFDEAAYTAFRNTDEGKRAYAEAYEAKAKALAEERAKAAKKVAASMRAAAARGMRPNGQDSSEPDSGSKPDPNKNGAGKASAKAETTWKMRPDSPAEENRADEASLKAEAERLMLANLAKSFDVVANRELIDKIYTPLSETETYDLTGHTVPSYREHYFNFDGVEDDPNFTRLRFLADVWVTTKLQRYWQFKGSQVRLFIPPMPIVREEMAKRTPRFVTVEGNKKAIALCLKGIPTLALQGVSTFSQKKRGVFLIQELKELCALQPEIWVCFDADLAYKTEVKDAQNALMRELLNAGARPFHITLPLSPTGAGADDYMLDHTKEDFEKLPRDQYALTKPLFDLNDDYGVVSSPPAILLRVA